MPGYWKPFRVKVHESVIVTREDAFEFSETLRAAFPRIRFVRQDFANKFFDFESWRAASNASKVEGKEPARRLDFTRSPDNELPDYFPSLADVLETRYMVWVEPPGWKPRWRMRKRDDLLVLENRPRLHFTFWRGGFDCPDYRRKDGLHGDPHLPVRDLDLMPMPIDRKEPILLSGYRMLGGWKTGDQEAKAFIAKVWRLLDKIATNRLVSVDNRTFQPIPPDGSAMVEPYVRAARGALAWARARRHNYLNWTGHWYKPEAYFRWLRAEDDDASDDDRPPSPRGERMRKRRA
jgi:hypothetical protein